MICLRCGAPIRPYVLTAKWEQHPAGSTVWVRSEYSSSHIEGDTVCDSIKGGRPESGWTLDQFHSPIPFDVKSIISDLKSIEADLR